MLASLRPDGNVRVLLPNPSELSGGTGAPELAADTYLNAKQLAKRIPFSPKALEKMRSLRRGPKWSRVGRRVVYRWSDVVAWIECGGRK